MRLVLPYPLGLQRQEARSSVGAGRKEDKLAGLCGTVSFDEAGGVSPLFALFEVAQVQLRLMLRGADPVGSGTLKVVLFPSLGDRV